MLNDMTSDKRKIFYHFGSFLTILAFVLAQFIDLTLFSIGNIVISFQKIISIIALPFAFVFMKKNNIPGSFILFGIMLILTNSVAYIEKDDFFNGNVISANISVVMGIAGTVVLYTALTQQKTTILILANWWIALSIFTSFLAIFQALGLIPLWTVSSEYLHLRHAIPGLYRGVGLKFDPNFQALMLCYGIIFVMFFAKKGRFLKVGLLLLGIVVTFSRMGIIVAVISLIMTSILTTSKDYNKYIAILSRIGKAALVVFVIILAVTLWGPPSVQEFSQERVSETMNIFISLSQGVSRTSGQLTSSETRLLLVQTAIKTFREKFLTGVGAYNVREANYRAMGNYKASHNTYLELMMTGGIWGLLTITIFVFMVKRAIKYHAFDDTVWKRSFVLMLLSVFGLLCLFLSLTTNSILWFPLCVVESYKRWAVLHSPIHQVKTAFT